MHSTVHDLLTTIRISADDVTLREYKLGYAPEFHSTTGASLLTSVTECDGGSPQICLYPLEFEWSRGSLEFEPIDTGITDVGTHDWNSPGRGVYVLDLNGDGFDDILYADPDNKWKWRLGNGVRRIRTTRGQQSRERTPLSATVGAPDRL